MRYINSHFTYLLTHSRSYGPEIDLRTDQTHHAAY